MRKTYYDPRSGNTYEIELDPVDGSFICAFRYVEDLGSNPIQYDEVYNIPQVHRHAIEEIIHKYAIV